MWLCCGYTVRTIVMPDLVPMHSTESAQLSWQFSTDPLLGQDVIGVIKSTAQCAQFILQKIVQALASHIWNSNVTQHRNNFIFFKRTLCTLCTTHLELSALNKVLPCLLRQFSICLIKDAQAGTLTHSSTFSSGKVNFETMLLYIYFLNQYNCIVFTK